MDLCLTECTHLLCECWLILLVASRPKPWAIEDSVEKHLRREGPFWPADIHLGISVVYGVTGTCWESFPCGTVSHCFTWQWTSPLQGMGFAESCMGSVETRCQFASCLSRCSTPEAQHGPDCVADRRRSFTGTRLSALPNSYYRSQACWQRRHWRKAWHALTVAAAWIILAVEVCCVVCNTPSQNLRRILTHDRYV